MKLYHLTYTQTIDGEKLSLDWGCQADDLPHAKEQLENAEENVSDIKLQTVDVCLQCNADISNHNLWWPCPECGTRF